MQPFVSIIVPTRNCAGTVEKLIKSLLNVNYENYEIIIVDSSSDGTKDVLKKYTRKIKVFHMKPRKKRNANAARNLGVKKSKGSILAFTDADCIVDRNWLRELVKEFVSDDIAVVGGSVLKHKNNIYIEHAAKSVRPIMRHYRQRIVIDKTNFHKSLYPIGCNFAVRKSVLKKVGFFDEKTPSYDEIELFWRILKKGCKIVCTPAPKVRHAFAKNLSTVIRKCFRYGMGFGYFAKKYPSSPATASKLLFVSGALLYMAINLVLLFLFFAAQSPIFAISLLISIVLLSLFYLLKFKRLNFIAYMLLELLTFVAYVSGFFYFLLSGNRTTRGK